MSLPQIIALSLIEIVGDFGLKSFANNGGFIALAIGVAGYIGVVIMLIISLQGSSVLLVNAGWDGISCLLGSIAAYVFLGERLDNYMQYVGILFIICGIYLLKIPWKKEHRFHIPKLKVS
jgi:multidrug transporter EmrE-like cation transporter